MRTSIIYIIIAWACFACSAPDYLSEKELNAYATDPDNGLIKESALGAVKTSVLYRTTDQLVSQTLGRKLPVYPVKVEELRSQYSPYSYFVLNISKNDKDALYHSGGGFGNFSDRLQTLAFRMDDYVNLTTSKRDTIPVSDFIYPRLYGAGGATSVLFVFNNEKFKDTDWVQFNVKDIGFGFGQKNFRFRTDDIEKVPRIDFKVKQD